MQTKMDNLNEINLNKEWGEAFDHTPDSVFVQDKDFTIVKANKATFKLLKFPENEVIGKKCFQVFYRAGQPWKDCPFEKTRIDKQPHTEEIYDPALDTHLLVTTSPIFDATGNFSGSIHIAKDITKQKNLELRAEKKMEIMKYMKEKEDK